MYHVQAAASAVLRHVSRRSLTLSCQPKVTRRSNAALTCPLSRSCNQFHIDNGFRTRSSALSYFHSIAKGTHTPSRLGLASGAHLSAFGRIRTRRTRLPSPAYPCSTLAIMSGAGSAPQSSKDPNEFRLPTDLKPIHYDLTVRTDLEKLKFDGFVKVDLDVKKTTSTVSFNVSHIKLSKISITAPSLSEPFVASPDALKIDETAERATLELPTTLPEGSKVQFSAGFEGELTGALMGYYRSSWEHEGKTGYYALTQFEPTAARRAFPCWDEPLLKATFAVTLISREGTVSLSNMPAKSEEVYEPKSDKSDSTISWLTEKLSQLTTSEEKWKITKFETTPPMSTYIVAFANGPFTYLEDSYKSPISGKVRPLRIYTTPDVIHQAQFALDVKRKVLPLYEEVFEIEYPLPKLDTLVATDFDAGAMENWGLITGRTSAFLLDPKKADIRAKKNIASTQSHEVAHMWFGNITTMAWWDYLYLNEGFASLMGEVIILDKVFPEWKVNADFITSALNRAFQLDAKLSSHPIEVSCPDANMINQIFDSLSYSKAASILRMLSNYVGEEAFLKGVSTYLKKHLYGNSVTEDLWDGIKATTGVDVPKVMDAWVKKMGFPVVTVTETKDGIHVRQDRFLETGIASPKDNETIWSIPLSIVTVGADGKPVVDHKVLLDTREKDIPLDTSKPFKLNAGTVGVFRVLYTPERFAVIAKVAAKDDSVFTFEDRIGIINDAPALAKAGLTQVSSALTLIDTFRNDKEYLVWSSITGSLDPIIDTWWEHPKIKEGLDDFRKELYYPIVKRLGYDYPEDEDVDTKQLRTQAVGQAANAGQPDVVEELKKRFDIFLKTGDDSHIPADLERITYITAAKNGGQAEWNKLLELAQKPKTPSSGISAILALTAFQDQKLIDASIDYLEKKSRDQDLIYFFKGFQMNFKFRRYFVERYKKNYDLYYKRTEGNFSLQYIIQFAHEGLSTHEDYKETEAFYKDKDTSKFALTLQQTLDTINSKAVWIERSTTDLVNWLENRKKTTA
ncbi:hypothetical protein K474DRAFT_1663834 [Panus rudis PR-1116 ss-1]|nr:hypothetical protein K474DRAFT_1663834 [Panus rudis PR-1116 ss-1]